MIKTILFFRMDESLSYLIGCYLGDGCSYTRVYDGGSTYQFSITSEDKDLCDLCHSLILHIFGKSGTVKHIQDDLGEVSYYQLVVCSKYITKYFSKLTAERGCIPRSVYESRCSLSAFSQGLMDTDGWISKTHPSDGYIRYRVGFKNTAPWVREYRNILCSLGVKVGNVGFAKTKPHEKVAERFTINTQSYCNLLGFRVLRKQKVVNEYITMRVDKYGRA